ncbi:hypothetical protein KFE25_000198 [Diacronema lutheri]|uniref:Uncharacterized protein n=2 Tax=Diacronema lutheri TaxID=2081491 RepID=A0A8J6CBT5_DIALT|nr:hypothetical protein KFE25_000198 [Diacronema lutheri]
MTEVAMEKTSFSREPRSLNPEHQAAIDVMRTEQTRLLHDGDYRASHQIKLDRDAAEARMQQSRVEHERQRQAKERVRLDKAWAVERERFEQEWARRASALEADNAQRIRVLEEVHMYALEEHEAAATVRRAAMHYRMSKGLLEYSLTEKQLALGERYDEAIIVKKRSDALRRREERAFDRTASAKFDLERERLDAAQQSEMDNLRQKCHALSVAHERERGEAFAVLRQKYKNLDKDVAHAFAMEFNAPPACEVLPTNVSRAQQSSTFRGTLKLESLSGSKGAIARLSELPEPPAVDTDPALAPWLARGAASAPEQRS